MYRASIRTNRFTPLLSAAVTVATPATRSGAEVPNGLLSIALLFSLLPQAWAQFTQQGPKLAGMGVVGGATQGASVAFSAGGVFTEYTLPSGRSAAPQGITAGPDGALWFTVSNANAIVRIATNGNVTKYLVPTGGAAPFDITAGPDGALWFSELGAHKIGRITTAGVITEYGTSSKPLSITAGPDGALWFMECDANRIGRITTAGTITKYSVPTPFTNGCGGPQMIASGPDGAIWYTNFGAGKIGRMTTSGIVTEYAAPTNSGPGGITAGPDGALWFAEYGAGRIGRITTSGVITDYATPLSGGRPNGITTGPDGALWYLQSTGQKVGRMTTAGIVTEYTLPNGGNPWAITTGPDGALWFTEYLGGRIGRITTAGAITEYPAPPGSSGPNQITSGPDGALWFAEELGNKIGRITTAGAITEFVAPNTGSTSPGPAGIAAGPDGALWFTEVGTNKIGRISTSGVVTEYPVPTANSDLHGITAGPDGALWFAEGKGNKIGRITTAGTITEYALPTLNANPARICAGPDGALWFTESTANRIGRITTAGAITEYPLPGAVSATGPWGIAAGPDGALWFADEPGNIIGRITTSAAVTEYALPAGSNPAGIAAGPDGALWFAEFGGNRIGRITTGGVITEYPLPNFGSPFGITTGPDGAVWFTEWDGNRIGRFLPPASIPPLTATCTAPPTGTVGAPYSWATCTPSGGTPPFTWSAPIEVFGGQSTGLLPRGLSLHSSTGVVSGTPTTAGSYPIKIVINDRSAPQQVFSQSFTVLINPNVLTLACTAPAVGMLGAPYSSATCIPSGGAAPYTWSWSGAPPPGLSLNSSSGAVTGVPSVVGSYPVTITVIDSSTPARLIASQQVTITISQAGPRITAVENAASFQAGVVPNSWITILGTNLSPVTDTWDNAVVNGALPTSLDGVSVSVGGQPAYISYVSGGQINALAPNISAGNVSVTVTSSNGSSPPFGAVAQMFQPAFFQWGNYAVATRPDYSLAVKNGTFPGVTTVPAKPGDTISLWGTGFGPTNPPAAVGVAAPVSPICYAVNRVTITVGGITAPVLFAGLSPGSAGLFMVNIQIPGSLADGDYPLVATVSGVESPSSTLITVQSGNLPGAP